MDKTLFSILACPLCKGDVKLEPKKQELICRVDQVAYPIRDGIPVMLESEARKLTLDEAL